jgi:signal transduction histidine kinase
MLQLLIVDEMQDRRAATADALCELPGVEVVACAADAARALALLEYLQPDVVIAPSDTTGASLVMLIDGVRRRGLAEVIVAGAAGDLLAGMREYWRDLGARAVVDTLPELVMQVQGLAQSHVGKREARRQRAAKMEHALVGAGGATSVAVPSLPRLERRTAPVVAVTDVMRDVLPRLRRLVHDEIELVLEIASDVPRVRCTAVDLERLALQLVQDAVAANPLGGKVWVIVEREGQRHVRIEVLDSSGVARAPGPSVESARLTVDRYCGALRVVDLGNATSLQVVLPAVVQAAN